MSILKIIEKPFNVRQPESIRKGFIDSLQAFTANEDPVDKENCLAMMVSYHAEFFSVYMVRVATTFLEQEDLKSTAQLMNSAIFEAANDIGIPFFYKDTGKSLTDEVVEATLENEGMIPVNRVKNIFNKIKDSHKEQTSDTTEENHEVQ